MALSGIQFFYRTTCPRDWNVLAMLKLKNVSTLPEVITRQQVRQIIVAATTQRMRVFFWTVYSMGLRLNEGLHLQVGDVDSDAKAGSHPPRQGSQGPLRADQPVHHRRAATLLDHASSSTVSLSRRWTQPHAQARNGQHRQNAR